jgi:hypothetical protein
MEPAVESTITAARPWVVRLARLGYAAKGVVYLLVGWLAAQAALGNGEATGSEGALAFLLAKPFGRTLLSLVALGLAGYALWRAVQAVADPERKGSDAKGLAVRGYMLASAFIHVGLLAIAIRLLTGDPSGGESDARGATARLMSQPAGRWLVALLGLAIVVAACQQIWLAFGNRYRKRVRVDLLEPQIARWVGPVARLGLVSRGVVFLIVGGFLVAAAVHARPQEAKGLGDALETLQRQPAGTALLLVVAIGLAAYGMFEMVKARYRVIALPGGAARGHTTTPRETSAAGQTTDVHAPQVTRSR